LNILNVRFLIAGVSYMVATDGRVRLTLTVDPGGGASIAFLDEQGRIVQRLPAR